MKLKIILIQVLALLLSLCNGSSAFAQKLKCGTVVTPQQVAKELANPDTSQLNVQFSPNRCFGKTLSVTAHIIADSLGGYGISQAAIAASVQSLNAYWAPICISFQLCEVIYIPNYKYHHFFAPDEQDEVLALYSVPNTINIFYTGPLEKSLGVFVGGYASMPGGPDIIVIDQASPGVIVHEMGHYFGLHHTFETSLGLELANGSNCATAGDLVCDTPADPQGGNTPAPDCQLAPYSKDSNGDWYVPHIGNIMSYYSDDCTCGLFTTQQYNRMASQYATLRFYLW